LLAIVAIITGSSLARAQGADTTRLATVVTTATLVPSPLSSLTVSSTVIDGKTLRERGIVTLADALRSVPSATQVETSSPGSETAMFIRGGERDYVLILVDGAPINEPGGFVNFATVTVDNVDRIEVVRGPASVLYGADAATGVVQIFTRHGTTRPSVSGSVRGGSFGTIDADATLHGGAPLRSYSLGVARHSTDGTLAFNSQYRNTVASGLTRLAGAWGDLRISVRATDAQFHYPTEFYGAALDSNSFSTERRVVLSADGSHDLSTRVSLHADAASSITHALTDDGADRLGPAFTFQTRTVRQHAGARADIQAGSFGTWSVGGTMESEESRAYGPPNPATDSLLTRWNRAVFAQALGTAGRRLTYLVGARVDRNERFGSFTSVRAGASVRVVGSSVIRAAAGTAFKAPQFIEISGGGFAKPNPGLDPERTRSWEIGAEQRFASNRAMLSATYFDQRFRDMIDYAPLAGDPAFFAQYVNVLTATARGIETEARVNPGTRVSVVGTFTVLRTAQRSPSGESRLLRRPVQQGALVLTTRPGRRSTVSADVSYIGRRDDTRFFADFSSTKDTLPSYTTLALSSDVVIREGTARHPEIALTARMSNVLNRSYEAVAGYQAPGRIALVGVRVGLGM
jgi:vitamin B12 transporter